MGTRRLLIAGCAALLAPAPALAAGLCPAWSAPEAIGRLDTAIIGEASGLEATAAHPDRLYHHNDSGDGPNLYLTDAAGGATRTLTVAGFAPRDVEDMAAGPCGGGRCLFLGDIGDNASRRSSIAIVVLDEPGADTTGTVTPRTVIEATYPDGAHNAESLAVHPNGDLFILTKTQARTGPALYRLTAAQIAQGGAQRLAYVAHITAGLRPESRGDETHQATAMDIAPDGGRFVVLTYRGAIEFAVDLSQPIAPESWRESEDWRWIDIALLPQAEAAAYSADGGAILYTTESVRGMGAPVMRQVCGGGF
jgi:hypothetical protein